MSTAETNPKTYMTQGAFDFAFNVGQLTTHLLLERAIQTNRGRLETPLLITEQDVKTVLTPSVLEAVISQLEETLDEETDDEEDRRAS